jgi:hypothetical protein
MDAKVDRLLSVLLCPGRLHHEYRLEKVAA